MVAACGSSAADEQSPSIRVDVESLPSPSPRGSGEPNLFAAGDRIYLTWIEPVGGAAADHAADPDHPTHALRFAAWDGHSWSEPGTIASGRGWVINWADFPSMVVLPDGSLAAHWLVRTGPEIHAYEVRIARSEDDGRTWGEPVVPHQDGTLTDHGFVSLFPAAGGGLGAVWLDGRLRAAKTTTGHRPMPGAAGPPSAAAMTLRAAVVQDGAPWRRSTDFSGSSSRRARTASCWSRAGSPS